LIDGHTRPDEAALGADPTDIRMCGKAGAAIVDSKSGKEVIGPSE
jgi:hypothetical protein